MGFSARCLSECAILCPMVAFVSVSFDIRAIIFKMKFLMNCEDTINPNFTPTPNEKKNNYSFFRQIVWFHLWSTQPLPHFGLYCFKAQNFMCVMLTFPHVSAVRPV